MDKPREPEAPSHPAPDPVITQLRELVDPKCTPLDTVDTESMHIRAGALIAQLKALNRNATTANRTCKKMTQEARQEMDQAHLRLQNFLYEKRHLEREIEKCRQFACVGSSFRGPLSLSRGLNVV
jgi:THO complex subunit 5